MPGFNGLPGIDVSDAAMDFSYQPYVIYVSGDGMNTQYHAVLCAHPEKGIFVHVCELYDYPHVIISHNEWHWYLQSKNKQVGKIEIIADCSNPAGGLARLLETKNSRWFWGCVVHNCASYCETLLRAAGSSWISKSNLPKQTMMSKIRKGRSVFELPGHMEFHGHGK